MTDLSGDMEQNSPDAIRLSALQCAWLAEIGLDRRMLSRYINPVRAISPPVASDATGPGPFPVSQDAPHGDTGVHALRRVRDQLAMPGGAPVAQGLKRVKEHIQPLPKDASESLPNGWAALAEHAQLCRACDLQVQRDQLVFGVGDTDQPDWLVVGEAPGKVDDRTGLPFQGKAGQLLHAMFVAMGIYPASLALGVASQNAPSWSRPVRAYFTNLVKCRPLGNRSPTPTEIEACLPYLTRQIDDLQPRRILALGRLAAQTLLQVDVDVDQLRGRVHHFTTLSGTQIPVIVTWHPAALLTHPQNKGQSWIDLNMAKQALS